MYNKLLQLARMRSVQLLSFLLIGVALYGFTLSFPFVFDDRIYILGNPLFTGIDAFRSYFDLDEFVDSNLQRLSHADLTISFLLRPMAYLTFYFNFLVGGTEPLGYRLVNIALHIANAMLLYHLLRTVIKHRDDASGSISKINLPFFAALLFLVHPLQTQSVTYIAQRFTVLAAFFYLATMLLYILSKLASAPATRKWCYLASVPLLIAGLLTNEYVITLPVTLVMVDTILLRTPLGESLKRLVPHIVCMGLVPIQVLRIAHEISESDHLLQSATDIVGGVYTRSDYAITQLRTVLSYLRLLILPYNQNFDPDYPLFRSLFHPEIIISIFIWSAFVVAGVRLLRRQERNINIDLIAFSIFWFPLAISVSSSFVPLGDLMFEYRSYLPSVAFFTGSVAYLNHLTARRGVFYKYAAIGGLCLFALVFSGATVQRNQIFTSRISLWQDTIKKSPGKARPHLALGNAYLDNKQYDESILCFNKALDLNPDYLEAYESLGAIYLQLDMPLKTVELCEQSLEKFPPNKLILLNLAVAYSKLDNYSESINLLKQVLSTDSNNAGVLGFLAELKFRTGNYEKAQLYLAQAMKADQADPTVDLSNMIFPLEEQLIEKVKRGSTPIS
jgi:tetratricopeptide (TPR) repeat protein